MIYMFLADGFEEIEALCPLDLLRRVGAPIKTVAVGGSLLVTGSHGITVKADMLEDELTDEAPQMIILPGGMPGTVNLESSNVVIRAVENCISVDSYISAICAAPMVLGKRGVLRGKEAICFPGFEKYLDGAKISDKKVVRDGKIITAMGMGVALDFGLELVSALYGREKADELRHAVMAD